MPPLNSKTRIGLTVSQFIAIAVVLVAWGGSVVALKSDISQAVERANQIKRSHDTDVKDLKEQGAKSYDDLKTDIRIVQQDVKQILREVKR